ncbi:hypothetical protein [Epilithonimonas xixisoli]|uniref:Uncharacterized protein n=1 Tax=Epilithonimonas xixisoli TaxID=1476462 RepID=A0A4R8I882_9FLAO|nr:hypothetical protein [Epilithonimonas xixisoli]TDX86232.1 hypothetical protein B0I22_0343 [Epilithonimonas xixisoli]
MEKKYKFLIAFFSLVTIISLAGFYSSYWSKFPRLGEFKNLIHIHFLAFTCWLILIIIQPILIMRKKFMLHRQLGRLSYFLAPILVLTIILLTKEKFIREFDEFPSDAAISAFIAFVDISSFSTFYLIAMFKKSNVRWHVAFIIAATLIVLNPGLSRILNQISPGLGLLTAVLIPFLVPGIVLIIEKIKYKRGILKSPYFLIIIIWTIEILLFITIPPTDFWKNVTHHLGIFLTKN